MTPTTKIQGQKALELIRESLDGHTYARDPSNGEYYANMTLINRAISLLEGGEAWWEKKP